MSEIYAKTVYVVIHDERATHVFYDYEKAIDYIFMICMTNKEEISRNIRHYNQYKSNYGIFKVERAFID